MFDSDLNYRILQRHLNIYTEKNYSLLAKMLFYKEESNTYLGYGRIRPIFEQEDVCEYKLEYGDIIFHQEIIPPSKIDESTRKLIYPTNTSEKINKFIFNGTIFLSSSHTNLSRETYIPRWLKGMNFHRLCRTIFTIRYFSPSLNTHLNPETTDVALPYFPTIKELILNKFGFNVDTYSISNNLHFALVPLYGYISGIGIKDNELYIQVDTNEEVPLTLKIYAESENQSRTFNFTTDKSQSFTIPMEFKKVNAILVDQDGILLDTREFFKKEKTITDKIEELILQGEGETVDFKIWDPNVKGDGRIQRNHKLAKLLTSFANTKGGKILFGVSDEADIISIDRIELDTIYKLLTNICDEKTRPRVRVTKDYTKIDNKIIGVFTIEKSEKIIQNVYDKHYYIRCGSTNRIMKPEEIESYHKRRNSSY